MSGPSDKALDAATREADKRLYAPVVPLAYPGHVGAAAALTAAHNPALGLDRSVCLRGVVEALRAEGDPDMAGGYWDGADFIERTFTKTEEQG